MDPYRKIGKIVYVEELVKNGLVGADKAIFTLPVGFRTSFGSSTSGLIFTTWDSDTNTVNRIQVEADGDVIAYSSINNTALLIVFSFPVD